MSDMKGTRCSRPPCSAFASQGTIRSSSIAWSSPGSFSGTLAEREGRASSCGTLLYRGLCSKSSVVVKRLKEEEKIGRNPSSESIIYIEREKDNIYIIYYIKYKRSKTLWL